MNKTANLSDFNNDIEESLRIMRKGGIILYPTDTIWGIGCDATNSEAVKKIYELKRRSDSKSMLVLVDSPASVEKIIEQVPEVATQLMENSTQPLTLILDKAYGVARELVSDDGSLGVRITNENFSKELCRRFGKPIVSTSANISGEKAPGCFEEISKGIIGGVDYIVNYRRDEKEAKTQSHIIKIGEGGLFKIIR